MRILKPLPGTLPMPERNLIADWLMSDGAGGVIADLSGNGNTGTFDLGLASPTWIAGDKGKAVFFDGGDQIIANKAGTLDITNNQMTILVRFYVTSTAAHQGFAGIREDGAWANQYRIGLRNGGGFRVYVETLAGLVTLTTAGGHTTTNKWHTVVGVYDGANIYVYFDGVLISGPAAQTGNIVSNAQGNFTIGRQSSFLTGGVSEVCVFNRALSAAEIALPYREPFYRYPESRVFAVA